MNDYWTATDDYLREHGGRGPRCYCGEEMVAQDDHGRFTCFGCGSGSATGPVGLIPSATIPQVTEDMPDEKKAKIPPINRLELPPTKAETELLKQMIDGMRGIADMGEKYSEAAKRVDEERRSARLGELEKEQDL